MSVKKSFYRIESILIESAGSRGTKVSDEIKGNIRLINASAKSIDGKRYILAGISAEFPAGEVYVILGKSGAGKSTLGKLVLGCWPDSEGRVLLDGVPLDSFDRDSLGPHVGYLPQDIELFQGSVASNIARMGMVDSEAVIEAARLTATHNFILGLAQGYDTEIGDRGSNLSGGQRQRLALARAIYKKPKLIVLDEPNANLDQQGDQALREVVRRLKDERSSVFLISHRPDVLDLADKVIVMESGKITFYGTKESFFDQQTLSKSAAVSLSGRDYDATDGLEPLPV